MHVVEALLQQLHQAMDELLLLIKVLIELIGHAVDGERLQRRQLGMFASASRALLGAIACP